MDRQSVLISGLGIAGPTLAYWLERAGFVPTIVEHAPRPRTEGYIIDFWGAGYDISEKMGLLPRILDAGYRVREVRIVDDASRAIAGFDANVFREATNDRYISLPRGDLSAILYGAIQGHVETLLGDTVTALQGDGLGVSVQFEHNAARRFDLVIGADGLHSTVRQLAFGPESNFERFLGYTVATFEVPGYRPRDEDVYVAYSRPGHQVARFAMHNDRTMFLFIVADEQAHAVDPHDTNAHKAYLHDHFSALGWECPQILDAMKESDDLYFDRVSQIHMEHWCKGRIALVGDAAFGPSLLAGQGSALAIIGAYVLAGELAQAPSPAEGFAAYERRLQRFMADKQKAAKGFASSFAPKTTFGITLRNLVTKTFGLPFMGKLAMRSLLDRIDLPDYPNL